MKFIRKNILTAVFFSVFAILLGGHSFLVATEAQAAMKTTMKAHTEQKYTAKA
ncbi:MAG: hypothetical protein MR771_00930 [Treponema succinifaciens]|uniref:hypothetical protein n=1 Tax=Treponema succinifaciens TaxID=167 RepID=UPI00235553E8|nr:hypothetical protein [Treponema succinifaciens]MCI6911730.1 hypothetical protein [Treponema succinifaciens]